MPNSMPAADVLDREFLEIRCRLLQLAASFDRLDRGDGSVDGDSRWDQIQQAVDLLKDSSGGVRAERLQMLFSLPHNVDWRKEFGI